MPPRYLKTPLQAPEYSHLIEVSRPINYWAVLKATILRLEALKVRPPRNSRLRQALEAVEAPAASETTLRCAREAYRFALEFWTIVRTLSPGLASNPRIKNLLQRAYAGKLDPLTEDQTSERARDAQFELWLGSWFAMGGRPTQTVEPDLRVALWFRWYGVAAKRVRSRGQLLKRVKDGARQIQASGDRGLVAILLDNYSDRNVAEAGGVGPGNEFFETFPEVDAAESWLLQDAPFVKGTLCFGLLTSWTPDASPSIDMSALERVILLNSQDPDQQHLADVLQECRLIRQARWRELQRFGLPGS
jgi:hypothetical protein